VADLLDSAHQNGEVTEDEDFEWSSEDHLTLFTELFLDDKKMKV